MGDCFQILWTSYNVWTLWTLTIFGRVLWKFWPSCNFFYLCYKFRIRKKYLHPLLSCFNFGFNSNMISKNPKKKICCTWLLTIFRLLEISWGLFLMSDTHWTLFAFRVPEGGRPCCLKADLRMTRGCCCCCSSLCSR